ncbi:peptidoglycan-binding protein [Patescibacteria group bacterium]|nr:MAG: peptidoglycan-binding protein [Patescibacteria group bacterium]
MKKTFISLAFVALAVFPSLASAATVDELTAKLQRLLLEVDQVRQELIVAQSATRPPLSKTALCVQLSRTLSVGISDKETGGDVTKLQKALAEDRTLYPEGLVTGYFGPATQSAVKRLQVRESILPSSASSLSSGVVESATRAFLASRCGTTTPTTTTTTSGTTVRPTLTESLEAALATISLDTMPASTSTTATISGSAKNLTTVSVEIRSSEVVYANNSVPVKDGRWSITTSALRSGSYQVIVKSASGGAIAVGFVVVNAPEAVTPSTPATSTSAVLSPVSTLVSKVALRVNGSDRGVTAYEGSKVLVSWSTENVSSCAFVSNPPAELSGSVLTSESGKFSSPLLKTTVFTLTCIGANGAFVSSALTVNIVPR